MDSNRWSPLRKGQALRRADRDSLFAYPANSKTKVGLLVRSRLAPAESPCLTQTRPLPVENRGFRAGVRRSVSLGPSQNSGSLRINTDQVGFKRY